MNRSCRISDNDSDCFIVCSLMKIVCIVCLLMHASFMRVRAAVDICICPWLISTNDN